MTTLEQGQIPATVAAARNGDPAACWTVYEHFYACARAGGLEGSDALAFLHRAAQQGLPAAQFESAKLLRSGWAALDSSGRLGVVDQAPTQASLDEAQRLLSLAAAQGHERAQHMLENLPPDAWDARTAQRSSFGANVRMLPDPIQEAEADQRPNARLGVVAWLALALGVALLLWGAWTLYNGRLAERTSAGVAWPIPPVVAHGSSTTLL